jgi:hypothetical protein
MRHVVRALGKLILDEPNLKRFISIQNATDEKGIAPSVCFQIQSDPISEVGVNGVQAVDILKFANKLFESLNDSYQCRENMETMIHIQKAIHFQNERTKSRIARGVEGRNEL